MNNMKIITTSYEDFVKSEIDEWGFDHVEANFAVGLEPTLVNGVWVWRENQPTVLNLGTSTKPTQPARRINASSALSRL